MRTNDTLGFNVVIELLFNLTVTYVRVITSAARTSPSLGSRSQRSSESPQHASKYPSFVSITHHLQRAAHRAQELALGLPFSINACIPCVEWLQVLNSIRIHKKRRLKTLIKCVSGLRCMYTPILPSGLRGGV